MFKILFFITLLNTSIAQTDQQLKQAKKLIDQSGMTESQIKSIAKSKGFSNRDINKAIEKYEKLESKDTNDRKLEILKTTAPDLGKSNVIVNDNKKPVNTLNRSYSIEDMKKDFSEDTDISLFNDQRILNDSNEQLDFFGYSIFQRDPAVFQASAVGAVDPNYAIGPGDEIIVMLWGETQFRQVLTVDREGFIFIPEIGQVFVNGLNLNLLESKLFRVLSQSYASLNPANRKPTTFLDISIGNLRPLRIQVLGEVEQPGAYTVSPSATLVSALYYFNGPSKLGSLRDIQLIRDNENITSIDFYDYLLTGKTPKNIKLQLDDIIYIPPRGKTVSIKGEVNRNAVYELKSGETLANLIEIAGGLKITAYLGRAQIDRIIPFEEREIKGVDRIFIDVDLKQNLSPDSKIKLANGDNVEIFSILDQRQNTVEIQGAVIRPGKYDLSTSMRILDLINNAEGLQGDALTSRADLVRTKEDFTQELIEIKLDEVLTGDIKYNLKLNNLDQLTIYSTSEMMPTSFVAINGFVKDPGIYPLKENMTLYDLIFLRGGFLDEDFKKKAFLKRAELLRIDRESNEKEIIEFDLEKVLKKEGSSSLNLIADDFIKIYSKEEILGKSNYVYISGYVMAPGRYELYDKNMTIYDLVFKAGGFENENFKNGAYLERADLVRTKENGVVKKVIPFNLRKILSDKSNVENISLKPNDEIKVYSNEILNLVKPVSIVGMVKNPGQYSYKEGLTIKDLILEAGGVTENIFKYKIEVARIDPNNRTEEIFARSFEMDMGNDYSIIQKSVDSPSSNFKLAPYDFVSLRADPYLQMQKKVKVSGAVFYPGEYAILFPNEKLTDIIKRAGGLKKNSYAIGSVFTRNDKSVKIDLEKIIKSPKVAENIFVQDKDSIFIATRPNMIQIIGEVSSPGYYIYLKGLRVKDVINQAGGFTQNVEEEDIFISFPNGKSKQYKPFLGNHKVYDGSIITVGRKKDEEPFDSTEYASELTSILANLAQAISLVILAKN